MDFHFLVMEKSWKISVEKEGHPGFHTGALEVITVGFARVSVGLYVCVMCTCIEYVLSLFINVLKLGSPNFVHTLTHADAPVITDSKSQRSQLQG